LLCILAVAGLWAQDKDLPDGVKLVAPGVWFVLGDPDKGSANATVIEMPDSLIVVDGGFPDRAAKLLEMLPRLSKKPVKLVFDTHAHGDHSYGNAIWTGAGAETMAFSGVKDDMDRWEPGRWKKAIDARDDVKAIGTDDLERPRKLLEGNRFTLTQGKRTVEFLHFGWGHTNGDGWVWLPKERVLVTGDAAVNGPYNYMGDAWIANWPKMLEAAIELRPEVVLPGHGPAGGAEILVGQRRFLIDLYRVVGEEITFKRTPDQMHFKLPEWDQPWVPADLTLDIQACYTELTEHHPAGGTAPAAGAK
jgi:glyoxylase-like metal-dependent hydrolase (beta-lactamase superfamily II)